MKHLFVCLLGAMAVLASCNKDKTPIVPAVPQEQNAGVIVVSESAEAIVPLKGGMRIVVERIEFMRGGSYVGSGYENPIVKSEEPKKVYFSGSFEKASDGYHLSGDLEGVVSMADEEVEFNCGGESVVVGGSFEPATPPETDIEKALCVSWRVVAIDVRLNNPNLAHKWTGDEACDLHGIAQYLKNHEFNINPDDYQGYFIDRVSLSPTPDGTVTVSFTQHGIQPVVGTWNWTDMSQQTVSYEILTEMKGHLFDGNASGSVAFEDGYNTLKVSVAIRVNDHTGTAVVTANRI